jgi:hypothetical protein
MMTILLWIITSFFLILIILNKFNQKFFISLFFSQFSITLIYIIYVISKGNVLNVNIPYIPVLIIGILMSLKLFFSIKLKLRMRAIRKAIRLRRVSDK